jgi:nitroreductase
VSSSATGLGPSSQIVVSMVLSGSGRDNPQSTTSSDTATRQRLTYDRDEVRMPIPYWYIDTGFTALLMLLAAVNEGLGAVFFGPPDIADFRARFGVPDEWTPIGAIAVGHPDLPADPVPPARASERKSLPRVSGVPSFSWLWIPVRMK